MSDEDHGPTPEEPAFAAEEQVDEETQRTRVLLASVEELRALLAGLSEGDRARVLDLARSLRRSHP